ncbi:MAG: carboxypeptidase-like regulatory domain-containing protein [Bacteroidota bacterium]
MRIKKIFGVLFLCFFYFTALAQQGGISINTNNTSLEKIFSQLEAEHNYLFSFKKEDIENIRVSINAEKKDIHSLLTELLINTRLEFEIVGDNYIILKKSKKPDPRSVIPSYTDHSPGNYINELCGSVVDSFTQQPLAYASIYFKKTNRGNYALPDGSFKFSSDLQKNDTVVVSYAGYKEKYFPADIFFKKPCPKIQLNYYDFGDDFIVVTDYLTDGIDLGDNGAATILRPNRIGVLPGQAEPDIFTTIQFLPGINSSRGESSNFNVRGGAADQNLLLWEGIPIYHASHYFGMISAFNPYIIDKIKIYRGGFGPEYGGRASSVIDMESADSDLKESSFGAGVNFLNAYTHGQVAAPNNNLTFVYSLRRSISDMWRSPTFENITNRNLQGFVNIPPPSPNGQNIPRVSDAFNFVDSHFKLAAQVSSKDKISGSFFYTVNDFDDRIVNPNREQEQLDILDLKSNGGSIKWERNWSERFTSEVLAVSTLYDYDYSYEINELESSPSSNRFGHKFNTLKERHLNFSNTYRFKNNHRINFGYQFINYDVFYDINHQKGNRTLESQRRDVNSNTNALYGEFSSSQEQRTGIDVGIRVNRFEKRNKNYASPRLRLWHNLSDDWRLQFNAGKHYQFVSQLVEFKGDILGIETPIWVMANDKSVPVLDATQYQLGLIYHKKAWVVDLQFFAKETSGLTSLATGFDPSPRNFDIGTASSRGVDLLVKKRWKDVRVWASYSLSKTEYNFPTFMTDSFFPSPFDQRHVFNLASQLNIGDFQCSLGFSLASGTPYSVMNDINKGEDAQGDELFLPVYANFNDQNLPLQHHLDASFLYNFRSKKDKKFKAVVGISFFNIYDQENLYSREYFIDNPPGGGLNDVKISIDDQSSLGFTPNAVVRLEW